MEPLPVPAFPPAQFSADRAVLSSEQDRLGRSKFAARLADAIYRCDAREGLVIGLSGPWGVGKSSIKNMALERVRSLGGSAPDVLEFNPWQFSGQEQITLAFFQELLAKVSKTGTDGDPEQTKHRANDLAKYSSYVSVASTTLKTVGAFLPMLSLVGEAGSAVAGVLKEGAAATAARAAAEVESLTDLKERLRKEFAALKRPILVVIDDIDRLNAQEVPQLFQLVKANADFPQILYLLLYEKLSVEKALDKVSNERGKDYLEKIVQVSFDVPIIPQAKIDQLLFDGLSKTLGEASMQHHWNKARWTELYYAHLQSYFPTLRAVYRFLASFGFQVTLLRGDGETTSGGGGGMEVNPIDLTALECLRLFEPATLHGRLNSLKGVLTRQRGHSFFPKEIQQEEVDHVLEGILEGVSPTRKEAVQALLGEMFPPVTPDFADRQSINSQNDGWFRDLRVCHVELFDRYFQLDLLEGEMSQADTERLLASLSNRESARAELLALQDRGLLVTALERLNRYVKTLAPECAEPAIIALCDVSDGLPEGVPDPMVNDPMLNAWNFCYALLRRVKEPAERARILEVAIRRSEGFTLPLELVIPEERSGNAESNSYEYIIQESDVETLKRACAERIETSFQANPEQVAVRDDLDRLLGLWRNWGNTPQEVSAWVRRRLETPAGLLTLLARYLMHESIGTTLHWRFNLAGLERFVPAEEIAAKLEGVSAPSGDFAAALGLRCFRRAIEARIAGRDPDHWFGKEGETEEMEHYLQRLARRTEASHTKTVV